MKIRSHIYFFFFPTTKDNIPHTQLPKHKTETADSYENKNSQTKQYGYGWMPDVPITLATAGAAI